MIVFGKKSGNFQQSTSQQLPVDRGAGGRGEALRYIYIYIYIIIMTPARDPKLGFCLLYSRNAGGGITGKESLVRKH